MPKDYLNLAKPYKAGEKLLPVDELPFEFLMNALRLTDGVEAQLFTQRTGLPLEQLREARRQPNKRAFCRSNRIDWWPRQGASYSSMTCCSIS